MCFPSDVSFERYRSQILMFVIRYITYTLQRMSHITIKYPDTFVKYEYRKNVIYIIFLYISEKNYIYLKKKKATMEF